MMNSRDQANAKFNQLVQAYKELEEKYKQSERDKQKLLDAIKNQTDNFEPLLEKAIEEIINQAKLLNKTDDKSVNYEEIKRKAKEAYIEALKEDHDFLDQILKEVDNILKKNNNISSLLEPINRLKEKLKKQNNNTMIEEALKDLELNENEKQNLLSIKNGTGILNPAAWRKEKYDKYFSEYEDFTAKTGHSTKIRLSGLAKNIKVNNNFFNREN